MTHVRGKNKIPKTKIVQSRTMETRYRTIIIITTAIMNEPKVTMSDS